MLSMYLGADDPATVDHLSTSIPPGITTAFAVTGNATGIAAATALFDHFVRASQQLGRQFYPLFDLEFLAEGLQLRCLRASSRSNGPAKAIGSRSVSGSR
jgi:hypothetical protein